MQSEKPKSDADDMRDVTPDEVQEEIPGSEIKGHLQTDEHSGAEAITDMADYGLTERGSQILMGQAAEYEIANVVDPSFTVVAKIRKAMLPKR